MLETVVNVGLCDATVQAYRPDRQPKLAWDCYRRLVQS